MFEFANVPMAYILWALFGLFGGHRFYVGRWQSGLVFMFTFGGCLVGWIIDGFLLPNYVEEVSGSPWGSSTHPPPSARPHTLNLWPPDTPHFACPLPPFPSLRAALAQHNKRVFQKQMLDTGNSLLFEVAGGDQQPGYVRGGPRASSAALPSTAASAALSGLLAAQPLTRPAPTPTPPLCAGALP
jgi:hypothetical protein